MNVLQISSRQFIKASFKLSVWIIEQFNDMQPYHDKVKLLMQYPVGTLGHDIAQCLIENRLTLVPKFESHDLKHVLLGYEMTPVDEIRMQAFMLGNGNHTFPCFAIFIFGALLLPDEWPTFYRDFHSGKRSLPVFNLNIEEHALCQTMQLKQQIIETNNHKQSAPDMKNLAKYGAIIAMIAGICGMLFCLPFLFSSNIADLVGAGFPFLGGAVLAVGGLISLSVVSRTQIPNLSV